MGEAGLWTEFCVRTVRKERKNTGAETLKSSRDIWAQFEERELTWHKGTPGRGTACAQMWEAGEAEAGQETHPSTTVPLTNQGLEDKRTLLSSCLSQMEFWKEHGPTEKDLHPSPQCS